jgi:ubiquinone/menaquinone biosynthesis C-methylase UbiE
MAKHICAWWAGYFLMNPLRRFAHNPKKLLDPYVKDGMTVLELGPGRGFFTLDLARLVGPNGKVIAIDIQPRMLEAIKRRASKARLLDRIDLRLGGNDASWANDLTGKVDFALAFFVMHEVPDVRGSLELIKAALIRGGRLLIAEPKMHVSACDYADTMDAARKVGFEIVSHPKVRRGRATVFGRN